MRLGFIVGKDDDTVPRNRKALKDIPKKYLVDGKLNIDVAVPFILKSKYPDVEIDIIKGHEITLKRLKQNDVNFLIGMDLINLWHEDSKRYKKVKRIFKNPKSKIIPNWKLQNFIYQKGDYSKKFEKNGIPVAPAILVKKKRNVKTVINQIKRRGWKSFIIKPYLSAFSIGFEKLNTEDVINDPKILKTYFKENKDFPGFIIQEALRGFSKFWEVRVFFINGKFSYAIGNKAAVATGHKEQIAKTNTR